MESDDVKLRKVLVMFGSKSDKDVYSPIVKKLEDLKINYTLRVCSAHRTPDLLKEILQEDAEHDYPCIIAGAGLAAHLPGVIASKTIKPIIGVPVHSNYEGLDAFLSIIQMPPGIPVMAVGVNQGITAALNAKKMLNQYEYVNLIGNPKHKLVEKAHKLLEKFTVTVKYSEEVDNDAINIKFVELDEKVEESEGLVIYCPISENKHDIEYAINMLKHTDHGVWVGLNRADNAALSAIEILNLDHRHDITIEHFRENQSNDVIEADKAEKKTVVHKKSTKKEKK